jgi:hypothetical protein
MTNRAATSRVPGLRRLAGPAAAVLALAGCAGSEPPACPSGRALQDAARMVAFGEQGRDITDRRFEARITDVAVACDVDAEDDRQTVRAEMKVRFAAEKGPANQSDAARFRYFVAIAGPDRRVLRRETFEATIPLTGNSTRASVVETLAPTLPLTADANPKAYRFLVGFELDREQLRYNRRNPL